MSTFKRNRVITAFALVTALGGEAQASGSQPGKGSHMASFTNEPKPTGTPAQQALTALGIFALAGISGSLTRRKERLEQARKKEEVRKARRAANMANETNPHLN